MKRVLCRGACHLACGPSAPHEGAAPLKQRAAFGLFIGHLIDLRSPRRSGPIEARCRREPRRGARSRLRSPRRSGPIEAPNFSRASAFASSLRSPRRSGPIEARCRSSRGSTSCPSAPHEGAAPLKHAPAGHRRGHRSPPSAPHEGAAPLKLTHEAVLHVQEDGPPLPTKERPH